MKYNKLGNYIRLRRERLGISLNKFAFNSEVNTASLSNFETGKSGISFNTMIKISQGFGQTVGEFITDFEKSMDTK